MSELNGIIQELVSPVWQTLAGALLIELAAFGLGTLLLRPFRRSGAFLTQAAGTALLIPLWGGLPGEPALLWLFLSPWAVFGAIRLWPLLHRHSGSAAAMGGIFLFTLGSALLLPYGWDEQTYQLALPLRSLKAGGVTFFPDNPYSGYPALTGLFFANAIRLGGLCLPRVLVSFQTVLILGGLWHFLRPHGKWTAWAVTAAVALSPLTLALNREVYVENFIALFTLGGLFCAVRLRKNVWCRALLSGLLAGAAVAVKPTGAIGALLIAGVFLQKKKMWKLFPVLAGTALIFAAPWYIRTFLHTGNPLYPYALFPAPGSVEEFHLLLGSARYGLEGLPGVFLSWLFVGFDRKLYDGIAAGMQFPLLFFFTLGGWSFLFRDHPSRAKRFLLPLAGFIGAYLLWEAGAKQSRFLLPLLIASGIAGAGFLPCLPGKKKVWLILLLGFSLANFSIFPYLHHYVVSWKLVGLSRKDSGRFLAIASKDPGYFQALNSLVSHTDAEAKVLLLFERRGLYLPRKYELAVPRFEPSLTPVPADAAALWERVKKFDAVMVGATVQDVDLQSANTEECKKVLAQIGELLAQGKLVPMGNPGYALLKVKK